jgi:microcystin-dependent protein
MLKEKGYRAGFLLATTLLVATLLVGFGLTERSQPAAAVSAEPFVGEISMFAGNFAPRGWAFCDGQLLAIRDNEALFSILGTTYGGDGRTTFALPDLRGRTPIHPGIGPGLSDRRLGSKGGAEKLPAKTITLAPATSQARVPSDPDINMRSKKPRSTGSAATTTTVADPDAANGNMQPFTTVHYIIALQGIYPSRS